MPVPAANTAADIPAGTISTQLGGPFSSAQYVIKDAWWNEANGRDYTVFAGALGADPSQGVVVVFASPADDAAQTGRASLEQFPTSGQDGSLQMTSSDGWTITLKAADGVQYEFNAAKRAYVRA
jgi:hypothetical protein